MIIKKLTPAFSTLSCVLLAFFLLSPNVLLSATVGKLAGKVTDQSTGESLPGANIIIEGTSFGAAADEEGDYYIINIPPGRYSVQVTVIGYQTVVTTNVLISTDHTTPLNFSLSTEALEGESVTVTAERETITMDRSASIISVEASDILELPSVTDVGAFLSKQVGFDIGENREMLLRGGGVDQIEMQVDGMLLTNTAQNRPMVGMINLSSIQELNIIKGGFNAEYGNVRSGVFSVVTKTGGISEYHGSADIRVAPPQLKHGGPSLVDTTNYFLRPYFDKEVAFVGTAEGWDQDTQGQYPEWEGWNSWSQRLMEDDDPSNDQTPNQAQEMFRWHHMAEGADKIGHPHGVNRYWDVLDQYADLSLSGPVPVIGKLLGNLSFFVSLKNTSDAFALPVSRPTLDQRNAHLKLTSRISSAMKLHVEYLYGEVFTIRGGVEGGGSGGTGSAGQFVEDPRGVLYSGKFGAQSRNIFYPYNTTPMDVYRTMRGVTFDHVLSPQTHYSIRVSNINIHYWGHGDLLPVRDFTILKSFGSQGVDETPYGSSQEGYVYMNGDNQLRALGSGARDRSKSNTYQLKFDFTNQISKYNQIKAGFLYNTDDLSTNFGLFDAFDVTGNYHMVWEQNPNRLGAYIQDKLEFEGMIANFGLRVDLNNPNSMWYNSDERYSKFYRSKYRETFQDSATTLLADTEGDINISPRLGVSHPISATSKLFFNYGHFYSMPPSFDMYSIQPGGGAQGLSFIGNPSVKMPRTIAYELGFEKEFSDILVRATGYYKNVSSQTGQVSYISYDQSVDYNTVENNNYADNRGVELTVEKNFGTWVTGFFNYDYRVDTEGFVGREVYYEDPRMQLLYGLQNPYQERPLARPVAHGNIRVMSPSNWGPTVGNINPLGGVSVSLLMRYKAGRWETWDPLDEKVQDNIQWKGETYFDMRLEKRTQIGGSSLVTFVDIDNVFNLQHVAQQGFGPGNDSRYYLSSLHLPMYDDDDMHNSGLPSVPESYSGTPQQYWGEIEYNDKPGDIKSDDKPYIDMPNRDLFTYLYPRYVRFGLSFYF